VTSSKKTQTIMTEALNDEAKNYKFLDHPFHEYIQKSFDLVFDRFKLSPSKISKISITLAKNKTTDEADSDLSEGDLFAEEGLSMSNNKELDLDQDMELSLSTDDISSDEQAGESLSLGDDLKLDGGDDLSLDAGNDLNLSSDDLTLDDDKSLSESAGDELSLDDDLSEDVMAKLAEIDSIMHQDATNAGLKISANDLSSNEAQPKEEFGLDLSQDQDASLMDLNLDDSQSEEEGERNDEEEVSTSDDSSGFLMMNMASSDDESGQESDNVEEDNAEEIEEDEVAQVGSDDGFTLLEKEVTSFKLGDIAFDDEEEISGLNFSTEDDERTRIHAPTKSQPQRDDNGQKADQDEATVVRRMPPAAPNLETKSKKQVVEEPRVELNLSSEDENNSEEESDSLHIITGSVPQQVVEQRPPILTQTSSHEREGYREVVGSFNQELERLQATLSHLRSDRESLIQKIASLEEDKMQMNRNLLGMRAELDEKKIEIQLMKKRMSEDTQDLKYQLELEQERRKLAEEKAKTFQNEALAMQQKVKLEIKKVSSKEKELEQKLELLKVDAETQIRHRDLKILEYKRKIDAMEFDIDTLTANEQRNMGDKSNLEDKLDKAIKTLRAAIGILESSDPKNTTLEKIKKSLDV
jgi:hypothetical protein